jgi:hypothetical protein
MFPKKHASGGQPLLTPPYLVLHCEEFAWPPVLPPTPVRSYIKPAKGPHHFTHYPQPPWPEGRERSAGWSLLCCTCRHPARERLPTRRPLAFPKPDAQPLTGSLPCSVRTFLSSNPQKGLKQQPPDLLSCKARGL